MANDINDSGDMTGKTCLVTGSTSGIGRETAAELAGLGARVIAHGRDEAKLAAALTEVRSRAARADLVDSALADLSSQRQIRRLASELAERHERLDVLVNNAGVYMRRRVLTEDGIEMTFAVNCLAPFLLTNLLVDLLRASAPARVVNVASIAHFAASADLGNLMGERGYDAYNAYAVSKLGVVLITYEMAERLNDSGVTANCLHPGVISTKLLHAGFPFSPGASVRRGAETPVYLAASPEIEGVSGRYFDDRRVARSSRESYEADLRRRLWGICERLTGERGYTAAYMTG